MPFPHTRDASLVLGIPAIDDEHATLLAEIGRLLGPPAVRPDSEKFSEIMSRLGHRLASHFEHEEAILCQCGLPADEVSLHLAAHRKIMEQYTALQMDLMLGVPLDPAEVLTMVRSWVVGHLLTHDVKLCGLSLPPSP